MNTKLSDRVYKLTNSTSFGDLSCAGRNRWTTREIESKCANTQSVFHPTHNMKGKRPIKQISSYQPWAKHPKMCPRPNKKLPCGRRLWEGTIWVWPYPWLHQLPSTSTCRLLVISPRWLHADPLRIFVQTDQQAAIKGGEAFPLTHTLHLSFTLHTFSSSVPLGASDLVVIENR